MFTGDYSLFEYKYNIPGYSGQDYGGTAQYLYLAVSALILVVLLVLLRKMPKKNVLKFIGALGIFLTVLDIAKITWESYYDIKIYGEFNTGLLPFDTCSLIVPAALLAGFAKGRLQKIAECWIATGGIVGGFATMLFLKAFKYYPFFSFGAAYSMIWHFLMVFMGLLIIVTERSPIKFSLVTNGYLFHLIASAIVIPIDFIFDFDFMLYRDLGGVPFFEDIAAKLAESGKSFLNPLLMLILYFVSFSLIFIVVACIKNRKKRGSKVKKHI